MTQAAIAALGDLSGTAYWVARYRAMETESGAPLFRDPWAAQLAGERGRTIVDHMPSAKRLAWVFVMRTTILDRLITEQLTAAGIDTVLNLAAGLDTRAFRLEIPASVRWYDVDTSSINQYKRSILKEAAPRCRWEAVAADLSDPSQRRALLEDLGARGRNVLVITEGLLAYLSEFQVDTLARDIHAVPNVQSWMFDFSSRYAMERAQRLWGRPLRSVKAHLRFAPYEGTEFFEAAGWKEAEHISYTLEALRLDRVPLLYRAGAALVRRFMPEFYADVCASGIVRLARKPQ